MNRALVLVGHGSRRSKGNEKVRGLAERVSKRSALPVFTGFIELAPPHASVAIDSAVEKGAKEIVVVPAVLLAAGHAKNDVPVFQLEIRDLEQELLWMNWFVYSFRNRMPAWNAGMD